MRSRRGRAKAHCRPKPEPYFTLQLGPNRQRWRIGGRPARNHGRGPDFHIGRRRGTSDGPLARAAKRRGGFPGIATGFPPLPTIAVLPQLWLRLPSGLRTASQGSNATGPCLNASDKTVWGGRGLGLCSTPRPLLIFPAGSRLLSYPRFSASRLTAMFPAGHCPSCFSPPTLRHPSASHGEFQSTPSVPPVRADAPADARSSSL